MAAIFREHLQMHFREWKRLKYVETQYFETSKIV